MYVNESEMSLMDISKFVNEAKQRREYIDYAIKTESYVLMKKELYEKPISEDERCVNFAKHLQA